MRRSKRNCRDSSRSNDHTEHYSDPHPTAKDSIALFNRGDSGIVDDFFLTEEKFLPANSIGMADGQFFHVLEILTDRQLCPFSGIK
jgi:hypothetical protein